jgi:hypothetical protein
VSVRKSGRGDRSLRNAGVPVPAVRRGDGDAAGSPDSPGPGQSLYFLWQSEQVW